MGNKKDAKLHNSAAALGSMETWVEQPSGTKEGAERFGSADGNDLPEDEDGGFASATHEAKDLGIEDITVDVAGPRTPESTVRFWDRVSAPGTTGSGPPTPRAARSATAQAQRRLGDQPDGAAQIASPGARTPRLGSN